MVVRLARYWWVLALRGVLAILFGIFALTRPGPTDLVLIYVFGAYALVDGIAAILAAVMGHTGHWWALLLQGLAGVAAGVLSFVTPVVVALTLVFLIAGWAIVTGILQIVAAIRLRKEITGEFWLALSGILSVLFGVYAFVAPGGAMLAITWVIGFYAIIFGVTLISLAFRLRAWGRGAIA